jgi:hypothetical protein
MRACKALVIRMWRRLQSANGVPRLSGGVAVCLAVGIMVSTTTASCSSERSASWTEEVATSDGAIVTVQRVQVYRDATPLGGPRTLLLKSATIRPLEPPGLFPPLTVPVVPLRLEINLAARETVLIGYADYCDSRRAAGNPPSGLVEYSPDGSAWTARPASDSWSGMPSNLLVGPPQGGHRKRTVDLAEKARLHSRPSLPPNYLRVTPSPAAEAGCYAGEP